MQNDEPSKFGIGLGAGWNAPYGTGVQLNLSVSPNLDLNAGIGLSMAGAKRGIGTRYYFTPNANSVFLGASMSWSTGLDNLEVNVNEEYGYYILEEGSTFQFSGGYKFDFGKRFMILSMGYGVLTSGGEAVFQEGVQDITQDFANLMSPRGLEVSCTIVFRIN
ncbi:hypothetical protein [Sediminitomix flava]|uniref:Outer membrane protein with beta-barrel domain n=1 Tax=Sediminitomix flava TaxID=379075 RepID=A0A315ZCV9_SEDFL|nr:hypothetical protein [Sediminitomix flava]PWJ42933.1 hypothetical protein BC781_102480 [Sediminitomix flava]